MHATRFSLITVRQPLQISRLCQTLENTSLCDNTHTTGLNARTHAHTHSRERNPIREPTNLPIQSALKNCIKLYIRAQERDRRWALLNTVKILGLQKIRCISWLGEELSASHEEFCSMELLKYQAILVQPWTGPKGSRRLRLPDFKTIGTWRWQGCQLYAPADFFPGKYCWQSIRLDSESTPGTQCGRKGYVNENFQWYHRESNPRPSGL
jgi:hypothetical protein